MLSNENPLEVDKKFTIYYYDREGTTAKPLREIQTLMPPMA